MTDRERKGQQIASSVPDQAGQGWVRRPFSARQGQVSGDSQALPEVFVPRLLLL